MPLGGIHWMGRRPQLQKYWLRQQGLAQSSGEPIWTAGEPPARPCLVQCYCLHTQYCLQDSWHGKQSVQQRAVGRMSF